MTFKIGDEVILVHSVLPELSYYYILEQVKNTKEIGRIMGNLGTNEYIVNFPSIPRVLYFPGNYIKAVSPISSAITIDPFDIIKDLCG